MSVLLRGSSLPVDAQARRWSPLIASRYSEVVVSFEKRIVASAIEPGLIEAGCLRVAKGQEFRYASNGRPAASVVAFPDETCVTVLHAPHWKQRAVHIPPGSQTDLQETLAMWPCRIGVWQDAFP